MPAGVYAIKNSVNGKLYIGSANRPKNRKATHWYNLNNNKGVPNLHLQAAWNKYGADSFEFIVLEVCALSVLEGREQYYIESLDTTNREKGYNKRVFVRSNRGIVWSVENKKNMSDAHKGEKCYWYGRDFTDEHKAAISNGKKGNIPWNKNKPHLRGESNPRAKLTEDDAREIRRRLACGGCGAEIARNYGVERTAISRIKLGKAWAWVV